MIDATLSRERFLLECAEQERRDLERANAFYLTMLAAARREGEAQMRERAARVCDLEDCVRIKASALAADIRALPLTPEEL